MKKVLLFSLTAVCLLPGLHAQITCNATSFDVDLSNSIDTTVTFQSTRNGDCCTGTNCIRFNLKLNPACSYVNFTVANPAPPGNAAYYQIDCGTPTSLGTPICIVGKTNVVITFCKPGNDNPIYTITAAGALKGSDDITVREGCTGSMNIAGLQTASIGWTSIYPGAEGDYNSWLNCTSGCTTVNVTPQTGAPSYVDYKVSGYRLCGPLVSDTIRVYTKPQIAVSITPDNASVCAGGSSSVTLTAKASGGDEPYNFLWSTGEAGPSITVNTSNTYTVSVTDSHNCLPATQSVVVKSTPLPTAPSVTSNSPVCEGTSLQLNASSIPGAVYSWTGPGGFTSSLQNPVITNVSPANAALYYVTVTVGQCTSLPASISVVVNTIPAAPTVGSNSPVCEGGSFGLTAGSVPTAVYNWTGPNNFTSSSQNPILSSVSLLNAGTYYATVTVNGCNSGPASTLVVINALPPAPSISGNSPICTGSSLSLMASTINSASYSWTGPNGFNFSGQNLLINNAGTSSSGTYSVKATVNGCTGPSSSYSFIVNPIPASPVLSTNAPVCEGSNLNLTASAVAGSVYTWTGPNGFSSSLQNPVLSNTSAINSSGTYSAYVTVNGCNSATSNLAATVKPIPAAPLISGATVVCEGSAIALTASSVANANYSWTGPNGFTSGSPSVSVVNSNSLNSGLYSVTDIVDGCSSLPATANVVVNSLPVAPATSSNSPVCSGGSVSLAATLLTGANYSWTGPNGFSSSLQNPAISGATLSNDGNYYLTVTVNGCRSATPSAVTVVVKQTPAAPVVNSNSPVCAERDLNLSAAGIAGAGYSWTGPNGFRSSLQNNTLTSVQSQQAGNYYVAATLNGCTGPAALTSVVIDQQAVVSGGGNQVVCSTSPSVSLAGAIISSQKTGIWTTTGGGSFSNPNNLITTYFPSASDKTSGSVILYLTSTNNGSCPASSAPITIQFAQLPSADAGKDQQVCANDANVSLNAQFTNASGGTWSTSGTGIFRPSSNSANATYIPGTKDKSEGSVQLTWTTRSNGPCPAAADAMIISIKQPPSVYMSSLQYVRENNTVELKPVVTGSHLKYSWTPGTFLNNDTILNPVCVPKSSISYKLIAKDEFGCSASADIEVKLLRNFVVPNVFTPNSDGINDTWRIKNLEDYSDCVIDIYNRYGQVVHHQTGYSIEWDGSASGKPLPAGTYYYIIDLKTGTKPLSGFVDIVR